MTSELVFYGFLLISLLCLPTGVEGVLTVHPDLKAKLAQRSLVVPLSVAVLLGIGLMCLGIYHGHAMTVLYMFLLPTAFGALLLRAGIGGRGGKS